MPIDSQLQPILDHFERFGAPPLETLSPENARNNPTLKNAVEEMAAESAMVRTMNVVMPALPEPIANISHILIPSDDGEILARVYTPDGEGPFPVLVYFHGGGWVIANLEVYEPSCRSLCNAAQCVVVSVAYRLAPEHKYPAAADDAYTATQWVMKNARKLNGDPNRIAVGGESAGGNLATVSCLRARDEGGRIPVAQLLIYPVTDARMNTPSYEENANAVPLNRAMMVWFWHHYLESAEQKLDPHLSPLLADLEDLPPAIVITAEFDPLRDEGEAYAERLSESGVRVYLHRYEGMSHEFFGLSGVVAKAKEALDFAVSGLRSAYSSRADRAAVK